MPLPPGAGVRSNVADRHIRTVRSTNEPDDSCPCRCRLRGLPPARAPLGVRAHEVEWSHMMASDTEPTGSAAPAQAAVTTKVYKIKHPQYGPGVFRFPVVQAASPAATRAINWALKKVRDNIYDTE